VFSEKQQPVWSSIDVGHKAWWGREAARQADMIALDFGFARTRATWPAILNEIRTEVGKGKIAKQGRLVVDDKLVPRVVVILLNLEV
jgi:hypothetical protein